MKIEHKARIRDIILISVGGILFAALITVVSIYVVAPLFHNARDDRPGSSVQVSEPNTDEPNTSESAASERTSSRETSSRPMSSAPTSSEKTPSSEATSSEEASSEETSSEETGRSSVWVQSGLTGQQRDLDAGEAETAISLFRAVQYSSTGQAGDTGDPKDPLYSGSFVISSTTGQVDNVGIVTRSEWYINGTLCFITSGGEEFLNYLDSLDVFSGTLSQLEP